MKARTYFLLLASLCVLLITWQLRNTFKQTTGAPLKATTQASPLDALGQNRSGITRRPRILCWILTGPENHMKKSIHVKRTWGSRCDKLLFMSSVQDPRLGTVALDGVSEGHAKLWPKTQKAFQYVWEHHRDNADWFMKADDDTFVLVDNLRKFLKDYNPNDPHYFGAAFSFYSNVKPINFGGTGYVLSREALRRFVQNALVKGGNCFTGIRPDYKGDEDTEMGLCLRSVGVEPEQTTDENGRPRFVFESPLGFFNDVPTNYEKLWSNGSVLLSNRAISFHYVQPHEFYVLEYLTHYLKTDY